MDFVKKHYEKVLLAIVLLGLVAATASLPFIKAAQQTTITGIITTIIKPNNSPLTNLNLTVESNTVVRATNSFSVDFGPPNKLFNPMEWARTLDNRLIPVNGSNVGPAAVTVTKTTP